MRDLLENKTVKGISEYSYKLTNEIYFTYEEVIKQINEWIREKFPRKYIT